MGFAFGVTSKLKRLFFFRQVKAKNPDESKIVNPITDFGSKDEIFFDTRVWMDSDCDDDFYSVNGDFTPSRGSTPNRFFGTPRRNGNAFHDGAVPTEKKKLAELLKDSFSEHAGSGELAGSKNRTDSEGVEKPDAGMNGKADDQHAEMNRLLSPPEGAPKLQKEKSSLAATCCLPGLLPSLSLRKQKTSPPR